MELLSRLGKLMGRIYSSFVGKKKGEVYNALADIQDAKESVENLDENIVKLAGTRLDNTPIQAEKTFAKKVSLDPTYYFNYRNNLVPWKEFYDLLFEHQDALTDADRQHIMEINAEINKLLAEETQKFPTQYRLTTGESLTLPEFRSRYGLFLDEKEKYIFEDLNSLGAKKGGKNGNIFTEKVYLDYVDYLEKIQAKWKEKVVFVKSKIKGTVEYFVEKNPQFKCLYDDDQYRFLGLLKDANDSILKNILLICGGNDEILKAFYYLDCKPDSLDFLDGMSEEDCKNIHDYYMKGEYFPISYYKVNPINLENNLSVLRGIPNLNNYTYYYIISDFDYNSTKIQKLKNFDFDKCSEIFARPGRIVYTDKNNNDPIKTPKYAFNDCVKFLCGLLEGNERAKEIYDGVVSGEIDARADE